MPIVAMAAEGDNPETVDVGTFDQLKKVLTEAADVGSGDTTININNDIEVPKGENWSAVNINGYYGAALVGANLLDILPSLYKSTLGLVSDGDTPLLLIKENILNNITQDGEIGKETARKDIETFLYHIQNSATYNFENIIESLKDNFNSDIAAVESLLDELENKTAVRYDEQYNERSVVKYLRNIDNETFAKYFTSEYEVPDSEILLTCANKLSKGNIKREIEKALMSLNIKGSSETSGLGIRAKTEVFK